MPTVAPPEHDEEGTPDLLKRFIDKFKSATGGLVDRHTAESLLWFRRRVSKDTKLNRQALIKSHGDYKAKRGRENRNTIVGKLFYFHYEAETAGDKERGVFDEFPMVFIFNSTKSKEGKQVLWGLNLHYATPAERAILYMKLLKLKNTKGWTEKTKLRVSWALIKQVAAHPVYTKCVHAYRVDRMKSRMIEIEPYDWEVAVFLQLQRWKKIT
jgi:hypothetical protein